MNLGSIVQIWEVTGRAVPPETPGGIDGRGEELHAAPAEAAEEADAAATKQMAETVPVSAGSAPPAAAPTPKPSPWPPRRPLAERRGTGRIW